MRKIIRPLIAVLATSLLVAPRQIHAQYGVILPGAGPVNRAMGGVAVATPVEPIGALFWNPAAIGALDRSQIGFAVEALIPQASLSSAVASGAGTSSVPAVSAAAGADSPPSRLEK